MRGPGKVLGGQNGTFREQHHDHDKMMRCYKEGISSVQGTHNTNPSGYQDFSKDCGMTHINRDSREECKTHTLWYADAIEIHFNSVPY